MTRLPARVVSRVALAVILVTAVATQAGADPRVRTSPFTANGVVVEASVPVPPNTDGIVGGFTLHNEGANPAQLDGEVDENGDLTIYYRSDTLYYECDAAGENCQRSTLEEVLVSGTHLKVLGRFYVANGEYVLIARYLWTPTKAAPPPAPPAGPNPQPNHPRDFTNGNLFGVRAYVVETKVDALGGFRVGNFDPNNGYGCGTTPNCKVQRIAAAHNNRITIEPRGLATTYYVSDDGGCTYRRTDDAYSVINRRGPVDGVRVNGRYTWGGLDWVFTATRVWTPAPASPEQCGFGEQGGPLEVFSVLSQDDPGTHDPGSDVTPETWTNSQWSGTNGIGDFGAGSSVMQLDWTLTDGGWEFWGTYQVAAGAGSTTSISGEINGLAVPRAGDPTESQWDISAQLTITQATGRYAGWKGDGQWTGTASGDWAAPPSAQQGTFRWLLSPT
jgi:hypothetical protein